MISLLFILPLIAGLCALLFKVRTMSALQLVFSSAMPVAAYSLFGQQGTLSMQELFFVDSLNTIIVFTVAVLDFFVALYTFGYIRAEIAGGIPENQFRFFHVWRNLFILSMVVSLLANNLGIYWIGLEATTLATAFLVSFYRNREALEASWKYVIMCSVGIAVGLFAIVILYFGTSAVFGSSLRALSFHHIMTYGGVLNNRLIMLSFLMALVGFGTKAGLAPMHNWLPDAHSQAPSPISSLLSGVLLNTALLGILRFYQINLKAGNGVATLFLIVFGLLTVAFASLSILRQHEYKRLFAYSSMENMGLITVGIGIGGIAATGSLLHILYHALAKALLFFCSGNIVTVLHNKEIAKVKGLLSSMPATGLFLLLGTAAILGVPPFSLFLSKFYILAGAFQVQPLIGLFLLLCFLLVTGGMLYQVFSMLMGESGRAANKEHPLMLYIPAALIVTSLLLLFWLPAPFMAAVKSGAAELGGVFR